MQDPALVALVLVAAAAISFWLSGMETGVLSLNPLRIRQLKRAGDRRAQVLDGYLAKPERFLWTILVGNTISNFIVLAVAATTLYDWLGDVTLWFVLAFAAAVFLFYVLCELLPKMIFRMFPNRLCLLLATPFRVLHLGLAPIVGMVARFSELLLRWRGERKFAGHAFGNREEVRLIMRESVHGLTSDEKVMIERVLDFPMLVVRQVAVPLSAAVTVDATTPISEVLGLCRERNLTRLPVWQEKENRRRIIGIVSLKTLLYLPDLDPNKTAGDYVQPAVFLNEGMHLEEAFRRLQRSGQRMGIVIGRDHRESGIISLQDILKAIFGEVTL